MKNLLSILIAVLALCGAVSRADAAQGRVDTRVLRGVTVDLQDVYTRENIPVFVATNTVTPLQITNVGDGLYFINPTNPELGTLSVRTFGLPNPTQNVGRVFTFIPQGNCNYFVSNGLGGGIKISESNTVGVVVMLSSNKTGRARSTGTNWIVTHN